MFGKVVIIVTIQAGGQRSYYITAKYRSKGDREGRGEQKIRKAG